MIIGISGKMGCGKTTFTNHLIELLGADWKRMSFGDLLKRECSTRFDFPIEWCYSEEGKQRVIAMPANFYSGDSNQMTVRKILQWWGTDVRRAEDEHYWVREMQNRIKGNVVIDDVRFLDELEICDLKVRLQPYPGYTLRPNSMHISETALDHLRPREWDWFCRPGFGELLKETAAFYETKLSL